ncbi:Arc family DNA-binding protein [Pseudochelatococcus contaminans]|uniref:Plasmid stability protein n=1 Tax=Pseudochelatococcus contaminans TaxID=1538103 RepID=A0A7W5Z8C8_9HYPH|nr:Arc family DNA-binding protein [Pseudochelatococcus contaminans]MBB3811457.1 plasmid stability protein [Pseudochelatococcus contaminans]
MSDKRPGRGAEQFMLRLPDGMRDRIRAEADKHGRSMNAEIIARLEATLDGPLALVTGPGSTSEAARAAAELAQFIQSEEARPLVNALLRKVRVNRGQPESDSETPDKMGRE